MFSVVQDSEEINALVQSCHVSSHEQDSILFQRWKKEYVRRCNIFQPMLHFVPVDSFGCSILVIEDNKSISEMSTMKQLQDVITVIIPHEEWPKNLAAFPSKWNMTVTMMNRGWSKHQFYMYSKLTKSVSPIVLFLWIFHFCKHIPVSWSHSHPIYWEYSLSCSSFISFKLASELT